MLEGTSVGGGAAAVERAVTHSDPQASHCRWRVGRWATIYLKTHEYNEAIVQLQQAIGADGTLWAARYNLACAYARTGRLAEAYDVLEALLAKDHNTRPSRCAMASWRRCAMIGVRGEVS